jgi:hypothetical protein
MLIHYLADNARVRLLIVPTSRAEKVKHVFLLYTRIVSAILTNLSNINLSSY